tara:strand:+ start:14179 stop:14388 length:210 start_codon:yes stop_codon:yes gene_type:complete
MKKKLSTKSVHNRAYRRRDLQRKQEATALQGTLVDLQSTHRQRTGVMIVVFVLALLGVAAAAMIVGGAA